VPDRREFGVFTEHGFSPLPFPPTGNLTDGVAW
jgi:hypothetical protein